MFSVCIASRGNPLGLWATLHACQALSDDCEYLVLVNGQEKSETHHLLESHLEAKVIHVPNELPPPIARDCLAREAKGDLLFFFDDHVLPVGKYFSSAAALFAKKKKLALLHSSYQPYSGGDRYFHFVPDSEMPTKGDYSKKPLSKTAYPCISGPHGGFVARKSAWKEVGGYGNWFQGFGGEEAYLGLKFRKAGWEVALDPAMLFYHFSCRPETRGYDKNMNPWNYEEGMRQLGDVSSILKPELWQAS